MYYGFIIFRHCGVPPISRTGNVGYNASLRQGSVAVIDLDDLSETYIDFGIQRKEEAHSNVRGMICPSDLNRVNLSAQIQKPLKNSTVRSRFKKARFKKESRFKKDC